MSDDGDGGGEPNVGEDGVMHLPDLRTGPAVAHYYGDYVRQIFIIAGVAMLIFAPLLISRSPTLLPFQVGGAIILVFLAALTNPQKMWVLIADSLAAGIGIVVFEALALAAYSAGNWLAFIVVEAITILFLLAFYFSLKTVRAMMHHQIGKRPRFGDFQE
ncbi:MAG: hypothetical protein WAZ27_02205 [Minisyncoccia bacterium]